MATYTGNPANGIVVSATLPADNTDLKASDVNVPIETLFDNDASIATKLGAGVSAGVYIHSPWSVSLSSGGHEPRFGAFVRVEKGQAAGVALDLPHGVSLTRVSLRIVPGTPSPRPNPAAMPSAMPFLTLSKVDGQTGAGAVAAIFTDPSPDTTAYNAPHNIVWDFSPALVIDRTSFVYSISFVQENGPNSSDGNILYLKAFYA